MLSERGLGRNGKGNGMGNGIIMHNKHYGWMEERMAFSLVFGLASGILYKIFSTFFDLCFLRCSGIGRGEVKGG